VTFLYDRSDFLNTNNETALGTMPVGKLLFQLAVPTIAAQVINALYNMVDRIYIGRLPGGEGPLAIAGLGIAFPIIMIISAFASMIGMGGSPRVSIKMGQQDHDGAEKILGNAVTACSGRSSYPVFLSCKRTSAFHVWSDRQYTALCQ